ncbi:MAG TPA: hypothetical protein PLH94_09445 [Fimbriimonadaceae bacterium]|nr:hypothetical protein [Fimbriimonadaceae bacterium]
MTTVLLATTLLATPVEVGRFAFERLPRVPGFTIQRDGFRSKRPRADTFRLLGEPKRWQTSSADSWGTEIDLGTSSGRMPSRIRVSFLSPGFELYFPQGVSLRIGSTLNPFLTWKEGSVGPGKPTPSGQWCLISFQEAQPPIGAICVGGRAAWRLVGQPGNYRLETVEAYRGWVRFVLPLGLRDFSTTNANELGRLALSFSKHEASWVGPTPKLQGVEVRPEDTRLTATWRFDRPGAVVPFAALQATKGGFGVQILSKTASPGAQLDEGSVTFCVEPKLSVQFPMLFLPPGRGLVQGPLLDPEPVSAQDPASIVRLALLNRLGSRTERVAELAEGLATDGSVSLRSYADPVTGRSLPFGTNGVGLELAAAYALLATSAAAEEPDWSGADASFDWPTWSLGFGVPGRRAAAWLTVAGSLAQSTHLKLRAAQLQAGLAARRASVPDPMEGLRKGLFQYASASTVDPTLNALRSPLRTLDPRPMRAINGLTGVRVAWNGTPGPTGFELLGPSGLGPQPNSVNLRGVSVVAQEAVGGRRHYRLSAELVEEGEASLLLAPCPSVPPAPR